MSGIITVKEHMTYGDAIDWCVQNGAVFRFVRRSERPDFFGMNESIPGDKALECAVEIDGRTVATHAALDSSTDPSRAVARALIACAQFFADRGARVLTAAN